MKRNGPISCRLCGELTNSNFRAAGISQTSAISFSDLRADNDALVLKISSLDNELKEYADNEKGLLASLDQRGEELKDLLARLQAAEDQISSATDEANQAQSKLAGLRVDLDSARRENLDLVQSLAQTQEEKRMAEIGLQHREQEVAELRAQLEDERCRSFSLESRLRDAMTARETVLPDPKDSKIAELEEMIAHLRAEKAANQIKSKAPSAPVSPLRSNGPPPAPASPVSAAKPRSAAKNPSPMRSSKEDALIREQAQQIYKLQAENEAVVKQTADAMVELKREHDRVRKELEDKVSRMESLLQKSVSDKEKVALEAGLASLPPAIYPGLGELQDGQFAGNAIYHALQNRLTNLNRQMEAQRREHERELRSALTERERLVSEYEAKIISARKEAIRTLEEQTRDLKDTAAALKAELGEVRGQLSVSEMQLRTASDRAGAAARDAANSTEAVLRIAKEQGRIRERERGLQNEIRTLRAELEEERHRADAFKRKIAELTAKLAMAERKQSLMSETPKTFIWSEKLEVLSRRIGELEEKFTREELGDDRDLQPGSSFSARLHKGVAPELRQLRSHWEDLSMEISRGSFSFLSEESPPHEDAMLDTHDMDVANW